MARRAGPELVVLLDESGAAIGSADKQTVHTRETRLHLAFSCYVFDDSDNLLVTRRALHKVTWPGVWTNSVCGHPAPGEELVDAVRRRARQELGLAVADATTVLPAFRYRAVMASGIVENEMCPVLVTSTRQQPRVDPAEVATAVWVPWTSFRDAVLSGRHEVSPWCREQVGELAGLGAGPADWRPGPVSALPPAVLNR